MVRKEHVRRDSYVLVFRDRGMYCSFPDFVLYELSDVGVIEPITEIVVICLVAMLSSARVPLCLACCQGLCVWMAGA